MEIYAGTGRSIEPFRSWKRAEIALLVDISPVARDVYLRNFPDANYLNHDLATVQPSEIRGWAGGSIDVLMGCPPCQGFSETGPRDPDDPRNEHVTKFTAFALAARPRAIVMENVPVAADSDEFDDLLEQLEKHKYRWTAMIANAAQYGSSQSRQRLLLVAIDKSRGDQPVFASPTHGSGSVFSYSAGSVRKTSENKIEMLGISPATQRIAEGLPQDFSTLLGPKRMRSIAKDIADLPDSSARESRLWDHVAWKHSRSVLRRMSRIPEGGRWSGGDDHFAHTYGRLHRQGLARTLTSSFAYAGGGRFWHPTANRSLTMREAARIQGFPDEFTFGISGKTGAKLIGNALDASLAKLCYQTVRAAID